VPQHLAEKLHAYTLPRGQENTRVRDLVDLVIIAATATIEADRLRRSVVATFGLRGTHPIPEQLPEPPTAWTQPFATIASEVASLPISDLREGYALAVALWDPFLANDAEHQMWLPEQRRWGSAVGQLPSR
jgi:hypothetical protein